MRWTRRRAKEDDDSCGGRMESTSERAGGDARAGDARAAVDAGDAAAEGDAAAGAEAADLDAVLERETPVVDAVVEEDRSTVDAAGEEAGLAAADEAAARGLSETLQNRRVDAARRVDAVKVVGIIGTRMDDTVGADARGRCPARAGASR